MNETRTTPSGGVEDIADHIRAQPFLHKVQGLEGSSATVHEHYTNIFVTVDEGDDSMSAEVMLTPHGARRMARLLIEAAESVERSTSDTQS